MKVYLAGKISKNDWRTALDGYRAFSMEAFYVVDNENEKNENAHEFETYFGELPVISKFPYIEVTGPFFLSCDHGCYHGDSTHGVGATFDKTKTIITHGVGGCEGIVFSQDEVADICKNQIRRADMVFAYINSSDCFGTLFEIGYAAGIGKPVTVLFENHALQESMWFIKKCADIVFTFDPDYFDWPCTIRRETYLEESTWIANRIAKAFGHDLFYVGAECQTEEEIRFYADYCQLSTKEKYTEYLKTEWWQKVRLERLKIDGYKCVNCGAEKNLQVHHTDYSRGWFHEDPRQDLITLCKKCHEQKIHGIQN